MKWFRYHVGTLNSRKVQSLPAELFKHWVNLLCVGSDHDGALPPVPDLAFALRLSEAEVSGIVEDLVSREFVDRTEHGLMLHDWAEHQYKTSTERTRAFRERSRNKSGTTGKREGNAPRAEQIQKQSRTNTENLPTPLVMEIPRISQGIASAPLSPGEDEFISKYPRKEKEQLARTAYRNQIRSPNEHSALMAGLDRWLGSDQWRRSLDGDDGARFVPTPDRFLAEERYLEHPAPYRPRSSSKTDGIDQGLMAFAQRKKTS